MLLQNTEPSREQIRESIRQTVRDAQQAAQQAAQEAAADVRAERGIPAPPIPPGPPGTPGVVVQSWPNDVIPPQVESISIAFFITIAAIIIGLPLMRAIARRIERGTPVAAPIPPEVRDQLQQISQSVEAIAIEVERISEGQRFTTKMLADRHPESAAIAAGRSDPP